MMLLLMLACAEPEVLEPLELPEDPAATGVPIGVRTVVQGDVTFEVWYPASDATAAAAASGVDYMQFISDDFIAAVGDFELPALPSVAVRDAAVRATVCSPLAFARAALAVQSRSFGQPRGISMRPAGWEQSSARR